MSKIRFILIVLVVISLSLIGITQNSFAQNETGQAAQVGTPSIVIDAAAPRVETSPNLYGIFYEEISRAGEGGISAELVQNRDFEATNLPEGWTQEGRDIYTAKGRHYNQWWDSNNPALAWSLVADGGAEGSISLEKENPLNERNPHSIKLTATKIGKRVGAANSGFWGMNIQQGEAYDLSFYARTEGSRTTTLNISLENEDGSSVAASGKVENVGGAWKEYKLSLIANATNSKARLVISQATEGTIWLDVVSLYPSKTFKGHGLRTDLCEMLAALKPSFMRFPGGCVVEGASLSSRWNWKETIGDKSQRRGLYNVWGYFNTYSLGYHELLQLCEDLNADAMYVCNVGMSCNARQPAESVQGEALQPMIQDALNALEYAMGPVTSTWGAQRAANGHPEPFKIKYIEIGNENGGQIYQENYRVFYDAIKAKYPDIITIADERVPNAKLEIVDEHFYVNPSGFFGMANQYDRTDRNGPKIYVGEYAVNNGVGSGNLQGALAEAVFMMNMEKNSDIVTMASYAPLFENVNSQEWAVNLIRFDNSKVIGRTSYEVQKLFSNNKPDQVLKTEVTADSVNLPGNTGNRGGRGGRGGQGGSAGIKQLYALAGMDNAEKELVIKVVNPTADSVNGTITINGISNPGKNAKVITLGHASNTAENTLENPSEVKPVEKTISISGPEFKYEFSPNSLTILRIAAP